jgi:predicted metal-dependent peptidase
MHAGLHREEINEEGNASIAWEKSLAYLRRPFGHLEKQREYTPKRREAQQKKKDLVRGKYWMYLGIWVL